jgi:predicted AAA+ superfamily ATPase
MIPRKILKELQISAEQFRVVSVLGPRQAGKSTLCRQCFPDYSYVSLEDPDVRAHANSDPRAFLRKYRSRAIIDEIQQVPKLLSYIQTIVDEDGELGQFVLTGSHQLLLTEQITQSLAGRTAMLTLLPLSCEELPIGDRSFDSVLIEGMMPGRYSHKVDPVRFYRSYFQTYVERDVRSLVQVKDLSIFEKFIRLCAGRVGSLLNLTSLGNEVGVSSKTIEHWISILEASFIIYRLPPFYENFNKRYIKSSKLYFIDTGLLCWLLGIENENQLSRDPLRGCIVENFVVSECLKTFFNRGKDPRIYFCRDGKGKEIDILIERARKIILLEIKSGETWHDSFGANIKFFKGIAGEKVDEAFVMYGGKDEFFSSSGYRVVPFDSLDRLGSLLT